jgi:hypothetical protein
VKNRGKFRTASGWQAIEGQRLKDRIRQQIAIFITKAVNSPDFCLRQFFAGSQS